MIQPRPSRIVVVTAGGPHVWIIVNAIRDRLGEATIILENPESKRRLLLRRAGKLGWIEVAGQLGTMVFTRLRKLLVSSRDQRNVAGDGTETELRAEVPVVRVASADSPELTDAVRRMQAEVVLLAGCRLLSKETLAAISCPVLNYHAGITPKYRGMNGGYWALATGDIGNFGATVHLVDAGVAGRQRPVAAVHAPVFWRDSGMVVEHRARDRRQRLLRQQAASRQQDDLGLHPPDRVGEFRRVGGGDAHDRYLGAEFGLGSVAGDAALVTR